MTKDASFKKVVRRHAEETGQRYTEALTDLEGPLSLPGSS
jgi:hypothetical protein